MSQHTTNILQHAATHCNTLQHTATKHQHTTNILQHAPTHCNTLQHTATKHKVIAANDDIAIHCNTLQHTTTHCNAPSRNTATRLQCVTSVKGKAVVAKEDVVAHCNTLQHTFTEHCTHYTHCNTHTATHCNTYTATHLQGTLQHACDAAHLTQQRAVVANEDIVAHCNTLQHTHCNTLQHTHRSTLQQTFRNPAIHLQCVASNAMKGCHSKMKTSQHLSTMSKTLACNTLQHTFKEHHNTPSRYTATRLQCVASNSSGI